ncbi:hypothetical protein Salat_2379700 [Sesamum alatum]|uniref:Uncharacterized protein n=1 Tax=Sesamum alatum TaxID=300844 RepID=A0AAE1XY73_9LAMI|nr:hypothetical protein Salat_2379700 [Sesamum alatum]
MLLSAPEQNQFICIVYGRLFLNFHSLKRYSDVCPCLKRGRVFASARGLVDTSSTAKGHQLRRKKTAEQFGIWISTNCLNLKKKKKDSWPRPGMLKNENGDPDRKLYEQFFVTPTTPTPPLFYECMLRWLL